MQKENVMTILISVILSAAVASGVVAMNSNNTEKKDVVVTDVATSSTGTTNTDNDAIKSYLMSNPQVIRDALVEADRLERLEAEKRIAELYKENLVSLHNTKVSPFVGPEDAKVTIVEFFDFNCGYCKRLAPTLMKVIKANPNVRFIFKPVAFLAPSSETAAKAVLAAHKQGKFVELYENLLTHNGALSNEVIDEKIQAAGLDLDETKRLMESEEVKDMFSKITNLSQSVQIRGVPTLIINGEPLQAIEQNQIQNAIDAIK